MFSRSTAEIRSVLYPHSLTIEGESPEEQSVQLAAGSVVPSIDEMCMLIPALALKKMLLPGSTEKL